MGPNDPFPGDADDTQTAMMQATYDALCKHGYADLTIQRIGDEFPKSKSLIYQHYDGKDELLVEFLAYMLDHFEADIPRDDSTDAHDRLRTVIDHILAPTIDEERYEFTSAMIELRGQAPHDEAFRDQFTENDRVFRARFEEIIRTGIDQGVFREVDPERVAEFVLTTIHGVMLQRVTTDEEVDIRAVRHELKAYLDARLLREEAT